MSSPSFPVEKRQLHTPDLTDVARGKCNLHKVHKEAQNTVI